VKLSRIESYSDAVFAIAATLLVLEIRIPSLAQHTSSEFWHSLIALWPQFVSYVTSFPFPTSIITRYGEMPAAVMFYGLTLLAISAYANYTWWYLVRYGYLDRSRISPEVVRRPTLRYGLGIVFYIIAVAISLISQENALAAYR